MYCCVAKKFLEFELLNIGVRTTTARLVVIPVRKPHTTDGWISVDTYILSLFKTAFFPGVSVVGITRTFLFL